MFSSGDHVPAQVERLSGNHLHGGIVVLCFSMPADEALVSATVEFHGVCFTTVALLAICIPLVGVLATTPTRGVARRSLSTSSFGLPLWHCEPPMGIACWEASEQNQPQSEEHAELWLRAMRSLGLLE